MKKTRVHPTRPFVVIGIDGGGSRSEGVLLTDAREVLVRHQGGPLNYVTTSLEVFRRNLADLVSSLRAAIPEGYDLKYSVVGSAALFHRATPEESRRALAGIVRLDAALLIGDAPVAMYGASAGHPGLLVVAGTGSIVVALDADGRFQTVGGYGPLIDGDPGSGFWMAREAVRRAARQLAESGSPDRLGQAILRHFRIDSLEALIPLVYGSAEKVRQLAGLSAALAEAKLPRETGFAEIQRLAGGELAALARPLLTRWLRHPRRSGPARIYLTGSVLRHNRVVRGALEASLQAEFGDEITFEQPACDPAQGAALLALISSNSR